MLNVIPRLWPRAGLLVFVAIAAVSVARPDQLTSTVASGDVSSRSFDIGGGYTLTVHLLLASGLDAEGEKAAVEAYFAEHYSGLRTVDSFVLTPDSWPASSQPVTVVYNQNLSDRPSLKDAGDYAVQQWNSAPGTTFRMTSGGTSSGSAGTCATPFVRDSQNTITYGATGGLVLGLTCPISNSAHQVVEADILFSNTVQFSSGVPTPNSAYDLWSVVLHEFGHLAGLDHPCLAASCGSDAVMEPMLTQGQQRRIPRPDDVMGMNAKYPATPSTRPFRAYAPVLAGDNPR